MMEHVPASCGLTHVNLSANGIDDEGLLHIAHGIAHHRARTLRQLWLEGNRASSIAVKQLCEGVGASKCVTSLRMSITEAPIDDSAVVALSVATRTLEDLTVSGVGGGLTVSALGTLFSGLQTCQCSLRTLAIKGCVSHASSSALPAALGNLARALSSGSGGEAACRLTSLVLQIPLSDESAKVLASGFYGAKDNALVTLSLSYCSLSDAGVAAIAAAVKSLTRLRSLDISHQRGIPLSEAGATVAVASHIAGHPTLEELSLMDFPVATEVSVSAMCQAVEATPYLAVVKHSPFPAGAPWVTSLSMRLAVALKRNEARRQAAAATAVAAGRAPPSAVAKGDGPPGNTTTAASDHSDDDGFVALHW